MLYLDTARLGRMSPRACRALADFARFAGEHGSTLYGDAFFREGSAAWPRRLCEAYPGLQIWHGLAEFRRRLQRLAGARSDSDVIVAARSAALMRFASRLLCRECRNILITDLTWPSYERILRRECRRTGRRLTRLRLRRRILKDQWSPNEVVEHIADSFIDHRCDGLFLPLVDNLGIHLPLADITTKIRERAKLRFSVVDGAQGLAHMPLDLDRDYCDLLIASCHKWLGGHIPLGVGFCGRPQSQSLVRAALDHWLVNRAVDDPLLTFTQDLAGGRCRPFGETVSLAPLFTADAATVDALEEAGITASSGANRQVIRDLVTKSGWRIVSPVDGMASRIALIEHRRSRHSPDSAMNIRRRFVRHGMAVTTYQNGLVRLSLPSRTLNHRQTTQILHALN